MATPDSVSPYVPGTKVSRLVLLQDALALYHSTQIFVPEDGGEPRRLLLKLTDHRVLTVGQLAAIVGQTRQNLYVKFLRMGIELPDAERSVRGNIDPRGLETMLLVTKDLIRGVQPSEDLLDHLPYCGPPAIIKHLTSYDYRKDRNAPPSNQ